MDEISVICCERTKFPTRGTPDGTLEPTERSQTVIFEQNNAKRINKYLVRTIHLFGDVLSTCLAMAKKPEDHETALQTKLVQLGRVTEKNDQVLESEKKRVIARHVESLKETIPKVNKLRISVEATQIATETSKDEIDTWNHSMETAMEKADGKVELLEEWLEDLDAKKERKQLEEKAVREDMKREKRLKFELKLHEAKMKLQSEINVPEVSEQHTGTGSDVKVQAKLPKLHITKFNGTYADWPRFWNLASETIGGLQLAAILVDIAKHVHNSTRI